MDRLYLDHAATTPLCKEAYEAMSPWLTDNYGNPGSIHEDGRKARMAIDEAREAVAAALGLQFPEVVFTSSGTEAANLAIVGAALNYRGYRRPRVLMSSVEHHCVLHCRETLDSLEYAVELIPVDRYGCVRLDALEQMLAEDVLLVCVMHANNELGTIQPVEEVVRLAEEHGALFFCDAVQTFGRAPGGGTDQGSGQLGKSVTEQLGSRATERGEPQTLDPRPKTLTASLVAVSAHKIQGPKGVGALGVKAGVKLKPIIHGGGQERGLRAGTENVAGIVGFGAAAKAFLGEERQGNARKRAARDLFLDRLLGLAPERLRVTVPNLDSVLPGHAHIRFEGVGAESMLIVLDLMGVSASSGAACSSGSLQPSHVLLACGYSEAEAKEGLRFTFGRDATLEEAEDAASRVAKAVKQITRAASL